LGIVGVIIAAPGLASVTMLGRYVIRKMLDLDPWPEAEVTISKKGYPWSALLDRIRSGFEKLMEWIRKNLGGKTEEK